MAHLGYIEDNQGDIIDLVIYCSDFCNKIHNKNYEGWNGCHELRISQPCECCGVIVEGIEETLTAQRNLMATDKQIEDTLNALAVSWYKEWRDNYLTLEQFARSKDISIKGAEILIKDGKRLTAKN